RKQLVEARKAEKLRRHSAGQPELLRDIDTMIVILNRRIENARRADKGDHQTKPGTNGASQFADCCARHRPHRSCYLAWRTAEPGPLDRRQIASLAGLAPHARESGTRKGARRIGAGGVKFAKLSISNAHCSAASACPHQNAAALDRSRQSTKDRSHRSRKTAACYYQCYDPRQTTHQAMMENTVAPKWGFCRDARPLTIEP
ncbi:IS110 family transposase, partial [Paraburkholderia aspalathi]|nr:IS110 family transposase [Paraburkholderia aspalathi]